MAMPPISLQTQASSGAHGAQESAANFAKTIKFGSAGTMAQALPMMLLMLAGFWLVSRARK